MKFNAEFGFQMTLIIYWKDDRKEQSIDVMGVDLDPSGSYWYYTEDPNKRTEVKSSDYHWARVL